MTGHNLGTPRYGITRDIQGAHLADVVERTRVALAEQGFGVLTEIDISATLKEKLDEDLPGYVILGACKPPVALQAIQAEPAIGLLLPCNVVVAQGEGCVTLSAIDPEVMFEVIHRPEVAPLAAEVKALLEAAVAAV